MFDYVPFERQFKALKNRSSFIEKKGWDNFEKNVLKKKDALEI